MELLHGMKRCKRRCVLDNEMNNNQKIKHKKGDLNF